MCLWKIDSHYHREKDISCNNKLHRKCVIVDSNGEGCCTQHDKRPVICP